MLAKQSCSLASASSDHFFIDQLPLTCSAPRVCRAACAGQFPDNMTTVAYSTSTCRGDSVPPPPHLDSLLVAVEQCTFALRRCMFPFALTPVQICYPGDGALFHRIGDYTPRWLPRYGRGSAVPRWELMFWRISGLRPSLTHFRRWF